ncbi:MAG: hypothetical protein COV45_05645 [Deltaproteobacteria bacterium CG11_big_fil_rev_8_21_14_0_20_47_16]|nr:MAG: hypothetical protein COV45_05645 [Deltaproteobacteria bacterium CG11_big_fil_rev_8_21_14_0_20_47_16]
MADNKNDETDLVEVGAIDVEDDVTEARTRSESSGEDTDISDEPTEHPEEEPAAGDEPFAIQMETAKPGQTTIASLRERFAAFAVDVGVLWLVYWGCLFVFNKLMSHTWLGSVPTMGYRAMLFHGIFLLVAFLYFFLLEAAFFATIGKFSCWMYVRRKDGRHAGTLAVLVRNFFRLIEMLTAWLLTWIPMELTRRHQRLGDLAAGTIVIKKHSADARYYSLDADKLASAFGRWLTWLVDIPLFLIWVVGYVMLINYQSTIISQWLVLLFPVVTLLFWSFVQLILETTPGMWLFGYTITQEDGGQLTFASAILRTLFAPIDLVFGLFVILLSLRKQNVGDLVAATVVSRQRRRWKGIVGSLVVVAICVGLVALGLFINPHNNVFKAGADFQLSFMPTVEGLPPWDSSMANQPLILTATNFRFGVEDVNTYRTPPVYEAGEKVYLRFEISGYTRVDRMIWVQEDLMVQYPDGAIGLRQENVVDYHQIVQPGGKPIELTNNIALPPSAPPGTYVVTVTLRDMLANRFSITNTQSFTVKAPPSAVAPMPPSAAETVPSPEGAPVSAPPQQVPTGPVTVPSSPIPVTAPTAPAAPSPETPVAPVPATPPSPTVPAAPEPAVKAPSSGFTVIPGPSLAPKDVTPPPIPVPVTPPVDNYAAKPADAYGQPSMPAPVVPAPVVPVPVPAATPPASVAPAPTAPAAKSPITEKTLTPTTTPAPAKKATIVKPSPKAPAPLDVQKAAGEELNRAEAAAKKAAAEKAKAAPATEPAKPAADIPSADSVKHQAPKKKSSSGVPSGGYMP